MAFLGKLIGAIAGLVVGIAVACIPVVGQLCATFLAAYAILALIGIAAAGGAIGMAVGAGVDSKTDQEAAKAQFAGEQHAQALRNSRTAMEDSAEGYGDSAMVAHGPRRPSHRVSVTA